MPDQDPAERIRRDVMDRIQARFDAKMDRRRRRWEARMTYRRANPFGGLLIGLVLAGIGVILLLQNLGIPFAEDLWDWWPVILIVVGGSRLVTAWETGGRIWGAIVAFAGAVLLLHNLGLLRGNVWAYFWPVILIAIGLGLLIRAMEGNRAWDLWGNSQSGTGAPRPAISDLRNAFKEDHIFSGAKRRIETQEFEGGEALVIFGGVEIDLRKAATKRDQIFIEANAIFGGIELRVPETWSVTMRGTGLFGGFADETSHPVGGGPYPSLIVTGSALFGGVSVKN